MRNEKNLKELQDAGCLWTTIDQLEVNLSNCNAKMSTLKVQINAGKIILEQNAENVCLQCWRNVIFSS